MAKKKETLCWTCENACGGCPWSRKFEPVEGWEAERSAISFRRDYTHLRKDGKRTVRKHKIVTDSYLVLCCPLYEKEDKRKIRNREYIAAEFEKICRRMFRDDVLQRLP